MILTTLKKRLDAVTGRVTMYRLVLLALAALTLISLVLAAAGQLAYTLPQLLASLAVSVVVTVATGILFALLFRTRPHLESSIITGVLIFFVLLPTVEPGQLIAIAIAGAIASLSKYVLAIRGRHIFNPAAIGAFIVTAFGLTFSGWWAATPYLLPVVIIGAFLVLYRTRRLSMGVIFVVVAVAIIAGRMMSTGSDPVTAITTAFTSYPIVFLVGFMLSEPLTLPPRRWQQFGIAVLVAVLLAVPFSIAGVIFSSPQLALVIGNLVAFFFGQRRAISLTLESTTQLTPTTWELAFLPAKPVSFRPGQYMELTLPHGRSDGRGSRRIFSISSAPGTGPITFAIKDGPSSFKRALLALAPGAVVRGTSVGGDFALPADPSTPTLLVAGGIGITPFSSQLADATARGHERDVVVVYSVSDAAELAYSDVLASSGVRVVLLAPSAPDALPANWSWAGNGRIDRELLQLEVPDAAGRRAFVSGPPGLVNDVRGTLRSLGTKRVTADYFSGY